MCALFRERVEGGEKCSAHFRNPKGISRHGIIPWCDISLVSFFGSSFPSLHQVRKPAQAVVEPPELGVPHNVGASQDFAGDV